MKGLRKCNVKFYSLSVAALLGCFFCSFIINQNNASAVSDITIVVDDTNYSSVDFPCGSDCSSYHYLLVSDIVTNGNGFSYSLAPYSNDNFARLQINYNGGLFGNLSFYLFSFDNADQMKRAASSWSTGVSFKLTLSENNPFGSTPSGSLSITENGTYDVTNYSEAVVDVPPEVVQGDYHDDLVNLKQAIIFVPAVALVIYFFYAIYKMLLGGKTL